MNFFLSRLLLNPRSRQVMCEMANPYEMHRTLMHAFPNIEGQTEVKAREKISVLFRVEADKKGRFVKVYVQSLIEPNWSFLGGLNGYLYNGSETLSYEHKNIWPAMLKLQKGHILSFRLRANPTKRIANSLDPMKGKRVELAREDDQIAWLLRKGREIEKNVPSGFDLLTKKFWDKQGREILFPCVSVRQEGKFAGQKRDATGGHTMMHYSVLFEGLLQITDPDAFRQTLIRGIGSGKAFGFGLLSLAPASAAGMSERT